MQKESKCDYCGKSYIAKSKTSKYCSKAHRNRAYEKRAGISAPAFLAKEPSPKKAVFKPLQTVKAEKKDYVISGNLFASNALQKLQNDKNFYLQSLSQLQQDIFPYRTIAGGVAGSYLFGKENRLPGLVVGGLFGYMLDKKAQTNKETELDQMREACRQKIKDIDKQIALINIEISVPKKEEQKIDWNNGTLSSSLVLSGNDVSKLNIPTYEFSQPYSDFIGHPTQNFSAIVYGLPKSGKSNFSIQFASYLARQFGKVLYVASEEGLQSRTLVDKVKYNLADNREIFFSGTRDMQEVRKQIKEKDYKFIFFDSLNVLHLTNAQLEEIKKENQDKAFISVLQSTKDGAFKGNQEFAHNCDVVIKIDSGVASQVGRFNAPSELRIFN
jgi:tRNA uridine 5-carbamoylmethylation protein Kti12